MEKVEGVKKLSSDIRVNSKKNSNTLNSNVLIKTNVYFKSYFYK